MTFGHLVRYGAVGVAQLAVEWLVFFATTSSGLAVVPANVMARVGGASLGYWLNARFTFANAGAVVERRSMLRFLASWAVLTVVGTVAVTWLETLGGLRLAWLGKPVVDVVLAGIGFLVSKHWIYAVDPRRRG